MRGSGVQLMKTQNQWMSYNSSKRHILIEAISHRSW